MESKIEDISSTKIDSASLLEAAADCFKEADAAESTLVTGGAGDWQDVLATFIQWGRKLFNFSPNNQDHQGEPSKADDTPNHHNPFFKLIYKNDGDEGSGLNYLGIGFLFTSVIGGFVIGVLLKIFQNLRKLELNTYLYAQKQAAKVRKSINRMRSQTSIDEEDELSLMPSKDELDDAFDSILASGKISSRYTYQVNRASTSAITLKQTGKTTLIFNWESLSLRTLHSVVLESKTLAEVSHKLRVNPLTFQAHLGKLQGEDAEGKPCSLDYEQLKELTVEAAQARFAKQYDKPITTAGKLRKVASAIGNGLLSVWNRLSKYSFIYWLVSLPTFLIFGTMGFPILPALIITLGIGLGFALWKTKKHIQTIHHAIHPKKPNKDEADVNLEEETDTDNEKENDKQRVIAELKQRYYEKTAHKATMFALNEHEQKQRDAGYFQEHAIKSSSPARSSDLSLVPEAEPEAGADMDVDASKNLDRATVLNSDLARRLLGSKKERIARWLITGIRAAVTAFVEFAFILGFTSDLATAGVVLTSVFTPVSQFLGGSLLMAAGGLAMGAVFGIKKLVQVHQQQLSAEEKVYQALTAPYMKKTSMLLSNGKPKYVASGMTVAEKIEQLEKSIQDKVARIKGVKATLTDAQLGNLSKYKLDNIDILNHDRYEKQREKVPTSTKIKKLANHAFTFLTGGQTGVLIARLLFLTGCIFAGALVGSVIGAPLAFGLIAASIVVVVGGLKLAQSILDKRNTSRENCVDTLNSRVSSLKKKEKELNKLEHLLNNESQAVFENVMDEEATASRPENRQSSPVVPIQQSASSPVRLVTPESSPHFGSRNSFTYFQPVGASPGCAYEAASVHKEAASVRKEAAMPSVRA